MSSNIIFKISGYNHLKEYLQTAPEFHLPLIMDIQEQKVLISPLLNQQVFILNFSVTLKEPYFVSFPKRW